MPVLDLKTNVKPADEKAFVLAFSKAAAEALDRPEEWVQVSVIYNQNLAYGGTFEPSAQVHVAAIQRLSVTRNPEIGDKLKAFFEKELGVPKGRCNIIYYDPQLIFQ
ncbi:Tautomerase/MIF [Schizophyllum commune H4-8]|nr:Tautomerase/MIF [Schizophyllum commune H4-8]KAI5899223.1 Tautomerase/MIF [Schizophyllum commune H4-8]